MSPGPWDDYLMLRNHYLRSKSLLGISQLVGLSPLKVVGLHSVFVVVSWCFRRVFFVCGDSDNGYGG